jgi:Holliday junction resolvase RusA-like endonuclease
VIELTVMGEPVSKERARTTRIGSYTPAKTKAAEELIGWLFKSKAKSWGTTGWFGMEVTFFLGSKRRRDLDNMLKLVFDALNGLAYTDDSQVIEVSARKRFVPISEARTIIKIYPLALP